MSGCTHMNIVTIKLILVLCNNLKKQHRKKGILDILLDYEKNRQNKLYIYEQPDCCAIVICVIMSLQGYILLGYTHISLQVYLCLDLGAVFGQTVTRSDGQHSLVAAGAISTQDGNAERLCLHGGTTHALLLHHCPLQGVNGLTATFALPARHKGRDSEGQ